MHIYIAKYAYIYIRCTCIERIPHTFLYIYMHLASKFAITSEIARLAHTHSHIYVHLAREFATTSDTARLPHTFVYTYICGKANVP